MTSPPTARAHRTRAEATRVDRIRQVAVVLSDIGCVIGTLFGVGVLGTRVEESSGGSLAADATLIAPAVPAFSIWSVIYLGLAAYTVWQALPAQASDPRARAIGWLAAASMLLNAAWLLVTQVGWIWVSVVVIAALAGVLGVLMRRLADLPVVGRGLAERFLVDGTFGLYLGWVAVATCANITAALVASGVRPTSPTADVIAVVVLLTAAGVGAVLARRLGGRYAVAAAMAWGLGWITWGRLTDAPRSGPVAVAAAVAAVIVVFVTVAVRRGQWVGPRVT